MTVQVEAAAGAPADLRDRVRAALREGLGVNPDVELLEQGTLPRAEQTQGETRT